MIRSLNSIALSAATPAGGLAVAVALDVALGTPAVGRLLPGAPVGERQVVGEREVDRPAGLPQRLVPRLYVGDVGGAYAVDLQVVHAPRGVEVRPRVHELLRARLGVVDEVHVLAVVVLLGLARVRDVLGVEARTLDR